MRPNAMSEFLSLDLVTADPNERQLHAHPEECLSGPRPTESHLPVYRFRDFVSQSGPRRGWSVCDMCSEVSLRQEHTTYQSYRIMSAGLDALSLPVPAMTVVNWREYLPQWRSYQSGDALVPESAGEFRRLWEDTFTQIDKKLADIFVQMESQPWWDTSLRESQGVTTTVREPDTILFRKAPYPQSEPVTLEECAEEGALTLKIRMGYPSERLPDKLYYLGKQEHLRHIQTLDNHPTMSSCVQLVALQVLHAPHVLETAVGLWDPLGEGDLRHAARAIEAALALLQN